MSLRQCSPKLVTDSVNRVLPWDPRLPIGPRKIASEDWRIGNKRRVGHVRLLVGSFVI